MKRLLISLAGIGITVFSYAMFPPAAQAGAIPKAPNNLGLVGYWSMEDCRGATSTDFSGSGNDGALSSFALSGTTSNWVTGNAAKRGCALDFDGINDNIGVPDSSNLNFSGGALTISAWIKPTDIATNSGIVTRWKCVPNDETEFQLITGSSKLSFNTLIDNGNSVAISGTTTLVNGNWYHVVATYNDSSKAAVLYVNGVQDATSTMSASRTMVNGTLPIKIGNRDCSGGDLHFKGSIDDVRIYNRALSQSDITSLYQTGTAKITTSQNTLITNGLVGLWSFNTLDLTNATATDRSGQGNDGTRAGGVVAGIGKVGQALKFDGVDDYVNVINPSSFAGLSAGTISAWVKPTQPDRRGVFSVSKATASFDTATLEWGATGGGTSTDFGYYVFGTGGIPRYNAVTTASFPEGNWYHVVWVADASGNRLYVNGVQQTMSYFNGTAATTGFFTDVPGLDTVRIGNRRVNNADQTPFLGSIDEVRVYNRALSPAEIRTLYDVGTAKINAPQNTLLTSGLVGNWSFNGPDLTTTTATDRSGQGNDGTRTGTAAVIGKVGQGLSLNEAASDKVDTAFRTWGFSTNGSISLWLKTTDTSAGVFSLASNGPNNEFGLYIGFSGGTIATLTESTAGNYSARTSDTSINDNAWHHVVGVMNGGSGTANLEIYVDGRLETGTTFTGGTPVAISDATARSAMLGHRLGAGEKYTGSVDEVRLYNRPLSAAEVRQLYDMGR